MIIFVDGVIGVAIDVDKNEMKYLRNGVWKTETSASFHSFTNMFPTISGWSIELFVNFGQRDFKFSPPDGLYKKILDLIV